LVEQAQRAGLIAADVDPRLVRDLLVGAMNSALRSAGRPGWSPEETAGAVEALLQLGR
jgi:hypothetical protein